MLLTTLLSALLLSPAPILVTDIEGAKQPQVAVDSKGQAFVAFGAGNSVFVSSSTNKAAFAKPVRVGSKGVLSLGMRRGPRIAATGKALVVTAVFGEKGGGQDGEVYSWVSTDEGGSWQGPNQVTDAAGAAREGLHGMASSQDGTIACVWLDLRNGKTEIWSSISPDGKRWSKNNLVYRSPEGSVCECCHPSVAFDGRRMVVLFRNSLGGNRDMYLATSDDGVGFSPARKLGNGSWKLDACPMDGGAVTTRGGAIVTAWRREGAVYVSSPNEPETRLGQGVQPWAHEDFVVWLEQRGEKLNLWDGNVIRQLSPRASDPVVGGNGTTATAAWEEEGKIKALWLR